MSTKSRTLSKAQQEQRDQLRKAYKAFKSSPNGRVILKDLQSKFYDVDMTASDEHSSSVKVGRHSVVLYIMRMMSAGET